MAKRKIALYLQSLTYRHLFDLAQSVHNGFVAHAATYPAPYVSTVDQQVTIDVLRKALDTWGVSGNRGGTQARQALIDARDVVREMLQVLAWYCMSVTPDDPAAWELVGFVTAKARAKANLPGAVQDVKLMKKAIVPAGSLKLKWKK